MSGQPFQIPGLGQAKPNETLPSESFAPDLLAAAASLVGVEGLELSGVKDGQLEQQDSIPKQNTSQEAPEPAQAQSGSINEPTKTSDEAMDVDKPEVAATEQPESVGLASDVPSGKEQDKAAELEVKP